MTVPRSTCEAFSWTGKLPGLTPKIIVAVALERVMIGIDSLPAHDIPFSAIEQSTTSREDTVLPRERSAAYLLSGAMFAGCAGRFCLS
jgi:hypothetical protein